MNSECLNLKDFFLYFPDDKEQNKEQLIYEVNFIVDVLAKELTNYIKYGLLQSELDSVLDLEDQINNVARKLNIFDNQSCSLSYRIGILKTIIAIVQSQEKNTETEQNEEYNIILHHRQLINLLIILYEQNCITHTELAEKLGITKSALTNMVHKFSSFELFYTEKHGRNKYYYSNFKTRAFYNKYIADDNRRKYNQNDISNIINIFIQILCEEIDNNEMLNPNEVLKRVFIGENQKIAYRKDTKSSLQNLTRIINSKSMWNYNNFLSVFSLDEKNNDSFDYLEIIRIKGDE